MPRAMMKAPVKDFIYYGMFFGSAIVLTHLLYLYVNGLV
jgi:hypothetical protein